MRRTRWAGLAAMLCALSGCVYGAYQLGSTPRYATASRPDPSYFCYDCHGERYFDPYYDWCTRYDFHYDWGRRPRVVALYRSRYLRLKEADRRIGRYNYPEDHRVERRYREPRDYDSWRLEQRERGEHPRERSKSGEQDERSPGKKKKDERPRDRRPRSL